MTLEKKMGTIDICLLKVQFLSAAPHKSQMCLWTFAGYCRPFLE